MILKISNTINMLTLENISYSFENSHFCTEKLNFNRIEYKSDKIVIIKNARKIKINYFPQELNRKNM